MLFISRLIEHLESRRLLCTYHMSAALFDVQQATSAALRVDAGGPSAFTDSNADAWAADTGYSGGNLATSAFEVAGTSDDSLYYTARYGKSFGYSLAVPNGQYTLTLLFADTYQPNQRKFDVSAEGQQILNDLDLAASHGTKLAIRRSFDVAIADGKLDLQFTGVVGNATVAGIQLVDGDGNSPPSPPPPSPPPPSSQSLSWQTVASSPIARAESVGAAVNKKLYVFGGLQVDSSNKIIAVKRSDRYDPATNKWTRIADMPQAITHAGIAVDGANIWLVGGYLGNHPGPGINTVYRYNTSNNTWSNGPSLPSKRGAGSAAIIGRNLHFFGGMNESRTRDQGEHWVLDLDNTSKGWAQKATLSNARNHTAGAAINGKLYAIGGQHGQEESQVAQSDVHRYDPATNKWTKVASLPAPRSHANASTFVMNGRIIVLGGENGFGGVQRTVYSYDPSANKWSTLGLLPAARSTSVAGVIGANQIISATGNNPNPTTTAWIGTLS